jgi:predicted permease
MTPATTVLVISASTPAAAMASIFAEKFDGDAVYASKIVSASTLLSMITMPIVSIIILNVI